MPRGWTETMIWYFGPDDAAGAVRLVMANAIDAFRALGFWRQAHLPVFRGAAV